MLIGLLGAFAAAVFYGAATILQAIGVTRLGGHSPVGDFGAWLRASWLYGAGLALDALGFLASVAALRSLPLFLVESAVASSVAVTALLSVRFLDVHLSGREWLAILGVALGLAALAVCAKEGSAKHVGSVAGWLTLVAAVAVAGLLLAGLRARGPVSPVLLAAASGAGFGGVGIASRLIEPDHPLWHTLGDPMLWALAAHGALATVAYGYALARGRVTTVAAITFSVETIVPAVIGLAWLGDQVRPHLAIVAVLGFVLTLGACIVLAERSEAPPTT